MPILFLTKVKVDLKKAQRYRQKEIVPFTLTSIMIKNKNNYSVNSSSSERNEENKFLLSSTQVINNFHLVLSLQKLHVENNGLQTKE